MLKRRIATSIGPLLCLLAWSSCAANTFVSVHGTGNSWNSYPDPNQQQATGSTTVHIEDEMIGFPTGRAFYSASASAGDYGGAGAVDPAARKPGYVRANVAASISGPHLHGARAYAHASAHWFDGLTFAKVLPVASPASKVRLVAKLHGRIDFTGSTAYTTATRHYADVTQFIRGPNSQDVTTAAVKKFFRDQPGSFRETLVVDSAEIDIFQADTPILFEIGIAVQANVEGNFADNPAVNVDFSNTATVEGLQFLDAAGSVLDLPPGAISIVSESGIPYPIFGPLIPGDFDLNGVVDGTDLEEWTLSYGMGASADADGDGDTDGNDFLTWQRNLGPSNGTSTSIPEPSVLAMSLFGVAAFRRAFSRTLDEGALLAGIVARC